MSHRPSRAALTAMRSTNVWTALLTTINVALAGSLSMVLLAILR